MHVLRFAQVEGNGAPASRRFLRWPKDDFRRLRSRERSSSRRPPGATLRSAGPNCSDGRRTWHLLFR